MERLKKLIIDNSAMLPDFDYYLPIIEKALNYEESRPDTAIECCNSLLQGFSKTIILNLEYGVDRTDLDKPSEAKSDKLVKRALRCLKDNDDVYEDDFATRGASLALAIATLRNARGDITHGKAVPKELQSHVSLAVVSNEMTGTILRYIYSSYLQIVVDRLAIVVPLQATKDEPKPDFDIEYSDNPDFNDRLDQENPLPGKMLYSEALFLSYIEEYQIQLDEFLEVEAEDE
jgi:hypothetical protein